MGPEEIMGSFEEKAEMDGERDTVGAECRERLGETNDTLNRNSSEPHHTELTLNTISESYRSNFPGCSSR
jgi:hypothetical protein